MATLTVGSGQQYSTIASAVAASKDGDVIQVQAGTYTNDFAEVTHKITIEGVGGMAKLVATEAIPNEKGILVTDTDVTIDHLEFSGATIPDDEGGNAAGIRYQGGNLTITNSYFHDNQNGILGNADPNGSVTIKASEFSHNGSGNGYTHNLYIGDVKSLTIDDSYFHGAVVGHEIKSRAETTTITNSRIQDEPGGTASYEIDLPNGGAASISNTTIEQSAASQNPAIISFGEEGSVYANSSLTISNDTILNDLSSSSVTAVLNKTSAAATIDSIRTYGLSAGQILSGPGTTSNVTQLSSEPGLDMSAPYGSSTGTGSTGPGSTDTGSTDTGSTDTTSAGSDSPTASAGDGGGSSTGGSSSGSGGSGSTGSDDGMTSGSTSSGGSSSGGSDPGSSSGGASTDGSDTAHHLVLNVSEDAWRGNAKFVVQVDGKTVGGVRVATASHAAGQSQAVDLTLAAGTHRIAVRFLNDAWGGTASTDRNLYVNDATLDGQAVPNSSLALYSQGSQHFSVDVPPAASSTLVIKASENGGGGPVQMKVRVDGHLEGVYAINAQHAAGQAQTITIAGIAETFAAHDIKIAFEGASPHVRGQTISIDSMTFDGQAVPGAASTFRASGVHDFTASAPSHWMG